MALRIVQVLCNAIFLDIGPKNNNCSFPVTRPTLSVRPTLNVFETGQFSVSACWKWYALPDHYLLCASGGHSPGGAIVVPFIDLNVNRCSWWMYMWCLGIVFTCFIQ